MTGGGQVNQNKHPNKHKPCANAKNTLLPAHRNKQNEKHQNVVLKERTKEQTTAKIRALSMHY